MNKVIVYSKTACGKCVFTKKWLESKGIPYEEKRTDLDDDARNEVIEMGYQELPVVVAGDKNWSGYQPDKLAELVEQMDLLTQLLLGLGALTLIVIIGTFVGIAMATIDDMFEERQQAKERDKRRK